MSEQQKTAVDVYLESETVEAIENQLAYGDTKSGWIRDACRERLESEQACADTDN